MTKERRLGRGLEALLSRVSGDPEDPSAVAPAAGSQSLPVGTNPEPLEGGSIEPPVRGAAAEETASHEADPQAESADGPTHDAGQVPIERIDANPFQPRKEFDEAEITSLKESLDAHGLLQPIVVRAHGDRFQLVVGERRFRAASAAGWTTMPARIVDADDRQMAELAIIENMQRKDLNALEKAASFQRYLEQYGCTQEELAGRLKLDRSTIANLIRLLELPEPVQEAVRRAKITPGHARALLPLGDEQAQIAFCERIQRDGMSVRQTERSVQETIQEADTEPLGVIGLDGKASHPKRTQSEHVASLEQEFKAALGTKVRITHSGRGRGKLVVVFNSHEEFERLRRHVCGVSPPDSQSHVG